MTEEYCKTSYVCGILIVTVLAVYVYQRKRPKKFPPGPKGVPFLGYAPFLGSQNPGEVFMKMKKKYGPVMSVPMGRENWVVLNDYDTIHEALVKQGEKFSGRPYNIIYDLMTQGCGLASKDYGREWKSLRKFGLLTLREFGVGKRGMEKNVTEESAFLLENLTANKKDSLRFKMAVAVSNIISRVVFGTRFDYSDKRFRSLVQILNEYFSDSKKAVFRGLIIFLPVLRFLPGFRGVMRDMLEVVDKANGVYRDIVKDHQASYDENDVRDFIDAFVKERKEGGDESVFNDLNLLHYIRDLYEAGTTTTSSTLLWCILALAHHPRYQERIYSEIVKAVGEDGIPTMQIRQEMPFTCSFIHEVMRLKTLAPIGVLHKTTESCKLKGFIIPENTTITPNFWAVHHDPNTFEEPDSFRPDRFINSDGNFVKSSHVIPFSVGPRYCIGEQLARMEIFIFLTSIIQRLKIVPDPKNPLPDFDDSAFNGVAFESRDFEVVFQER